MVSVLSRPTKEIMLSLSQEKQSSQALGGRLQKFLSFWQKITHDKFVLNCIKGIEIELTQ